MKAEGNDGRVMEEQCEMNDLRAVTGRFWRLTQNAQLVDDSRSEGQFVLLSLVVIACIIQP